MNSYKTASLFLSGKAAILPECLFDKGFEELHLIDVLHGDGLLGVGSDNIDNLFVNPLLRNLKNLMWSGLNNITIGIETGICLI